MERSGHRGQSPTSRIRRWRCRQPLTWLNQLRKRVALSPIASL